jgi:zinc/manganese transport system permease protein
VFSSFMMSTWIAASMVAVIAGVVGYFAVLRGSAFAAHAIPQGAFAGAAGASLIGASTILGLGVFAVAGALVISWLGRRGRQDVATALVLVVLLGCGALFLSFSVEYAPEIYSLLFGEVLGVARSDLLPLAVLGVVCIAAVVVLYRPLTLTSVLADAGEARGVRASRMELCFLVIVALATTMTVPVVGAFLMFSLMIAPAAAARLLTSRPSFSLGLSVAIALVTVWAAVFASYESQWPVGFFVGTIGMAAYAAARAWAWVVRTRSVTPAGAVLSHGRRESVTQ